MLRELLARFGIEVDTSGVKKGEKATDSFAEGLMGLGQAFAGAALVGGLAHFTQGLIDMGSELDDQANRLGMNAEDLQFWRHAAGQAGASAEELGSGLKILTKQLGDAADGGSSAQEFAKLGISVKDAQGKARDATDVVEDLADVIQKTEGNTEQAAIALNFFGKGGMALLPLLKDGSKGLDEVQKRFAELGGGLSNEFVKAADEAGDAQAELKLATLSLKSGIGVALLPAVTGIVNKITDLVVWVRKATENTNGFRVLLGLVGAASVVTGIKLAAGAAAKMGIVQAAAGGASQGILGTVTAFGKLVKAGMNVGLKIAILFFILEDLYTLFTGGDSAIGRFIDGMFGVGTSAQFVEKCKEAWTDLTDAVVSLWPYAEWLGGQIKIFLKDMFNGFHDTRKDISEAWHLLGEDLEDFWNKAAQWAAAGLAKIGTTIEQFKKDHPVIMGLANIATLGAAGSASSLVSGMATTQANAVGSLNTGKATEVRNNTTINVNGAGDPGTVANRVAVAQKTVNNNVAALAALSRP